MYKYEHFIPENIAPVGATNIGVYNGAGENVCDIPLGNLAPPKATKRYSFCAISDVHISGSESYKTSVEDFQNALTFVENSDCAFTCICGDLTENGGDVQLSKYKGIVDAYAKTKPVYAISGNHEFYSVYNILEQFTEKHLYYTVSNKPTDYASRNYYNSAVGENDVFVMVGHAGTWDAGTQFTVAELQWLYETLEANRNKRCFVFCHVFPYKDGVGNANGAYPNDMWTSTVGTVFENLMKHYKNTVLFHGHSHFRFSLQMVDEKANYSSAVGYRSVHIPSLAVPRDGAYATIHAESEGYIVDVYDDYIILNGRDFIDNEKDGHWLAIATYKIDTTLQTVTPNKFKDITGTITT